MAFFTKCMNWMGTFIKMDTTTLFFKLNVAVYSKDRIERSCETKWQSAWSKTRDVFLHIVQFKLGNCELNCTLKTSLIVHQSMYLCHQYCWWTFSYHFIVLIIHIQFIMACYWHFCYYQYACSCIWLHILSKISFSKLIIKYWSNFQDCDWT